MGTETKPVTLVDLVGAVRGRTEIELHGENVPVADVHMDSRSVTAGSLYVAVRGANADGHDFINGAINRGAVAAVVDRAPEENVPYLLVPDTRQALGWLAAEVHHHPSDQLGTVGITGTNGKTTVAHMLAAMAPGSGRHMAVVGTVPANLEDLEISPRTTPEASDLQRTLRQLVDRSRVTDVAIEVSSHAMEMGRVNGARFDVVAFTNLSQDHLDYHGTMENYFAAKAKLFSAQWAPHAVIWVDDAWGRRLVRETDIPVTTVGTAEDADVSVSYGDDTPAGSTFALALDGRSREVGTSLAGRFNVANAAIALACLDKLGFDLEAAIDRLAVMDPIPGRYNTIPNERGLWIVIDYAHTPDAIEDVIAETRGLIPGRIIAVGGAGGDRDQAKRPLMGRALSTADVAIVTTDNPRSEDPEAIIDAVMTGTEGRVIAEIDRRLAIRTALAEAKDGDAVLILGKGHEPEQEFRDQIVAFDDAAVTREELAILGGTS